MSKEDRGVGKVAPEDSPEVPFRIEMPREQSSNATRYGATLFTDSSIPAGVDFTYHRGAVGRSLMVEATGGGAGWLDFDRDGAADLYCVQGALQSDATLGPPNRMFRNIGAGRFTEVLGNSIASSQRYGHGVSCGDFDNDGFEDIYVSNVSGNELFRNMGDGTFLLAEESGTEGNQWSSSCAWADLDKDGLLDLFVCNYLDYDPLDPTVCLDRSGKPGTCHPRFIDPVPNACFHNNGDGSFTDIAATHGLQGPGSKSLGVVIADLTEDQWPDIYVANDTTGNFLFVNQKDGTFVENALVMGCALNGPGAFEASMGIACGDYNEDGRLDLYATHFTNESNTLYQNVGPTGFVDVTVRTGLQSMTQPYLGFGTVMADFNRDGQQELFVTNGHIDDWRDRGELLLMPPQLFQFDGNHWVDHSEDAGEIFQNDFLGRGVASCDYDDDGDLDLFVVHQDAKAALLRNDTTSGHYLKLLFRGWQSNRFGIGVKVSAKQDGRTFWQELAGGTSYCSSHEHMLLFGLPNSESKVSLQVVWPQGKIQVYEGVAVDQTLTIVERHEDAK